MTVAKQTTITGACSCDPKQSKWHDVNIFDRLSQSEYRRQACDLTFKLAILISHFRRRKQTCFHRVTLARSASARRKVKRRHVVYNRQKNALFARGRRSLSALIQSGWSLSARAPAKRERPTHSGRRK